MDPNLPKTVSDVKTAVPSESIGKKIIMFGLPTCPHCARGKQFFAEHQVEYEYHDVAVEGKARDWLTSFVDFVPVLILKDGSLVYGPEDSDLVQKLGL